jgi:outer membrane protein assembly factor BamB
MVNMKRRRLHNGATGALAGIAIALFFFLDLPAAIARQNGPAVSKERDSENWPRFRGPHSIPVSDNPKLPDRWSTTENVEWVAEVPGVGWSSPIVWGGKVFLTSATSEQKMKQPSLGTDFSNDYIAELRAEGLSPEEVNERLFARDRELPHEIVISLMVFCYDLETGTKLWEHQIYRGHPLGGRHRKNSFASETPVTDGEHVFVYFTHNGLFAYDFEGKQAWATPLEPHQTSRDFGTGASPALHKDRLFILNDNEDQGFIAAFDKRTGKELWRKNRTIEARRKTGWATPFVWENGLRTEVVTSGPGVIISYDLNGNELWQMKRMSGSPIQTPFAWDGLLYVTSGSSGGQNKPLAAIRPGGSGDITPAEGEDKSDHVAWYDRRAGGTYLPTPLIYDDALYVLTEKGIFSRHDPKTGERVYRSRVAPGAAAFTTSPWAYNGKVFVTGEEGTTYVIEAGRSYRLLGTNQLDDWTLASPAIVGDRLLIRTQSRLYSIRSLDQ